MKGVLERTVEVKSEYEGVLRELLMHDGIKDFVIEICMRNR